MQKDIVTEIFSDKISDPQFAMRGELDINSLHELADNIKQNGLINPITVRPKGDGFEVVAGHRRLSACKIAGIIKIPCIVRELSDKETFEIMTAENLERADVDPVDEADHLARQIEMTGKSAAEIAKSIQRSVSYVETRLAVGQMPPYMKQYLKSGALKLGVALALFQIENETIREKWTHLAVEQGTSVATAEFQLHDYRVNKSIYDGIVQDNPNSQNLPEPKPIMFRCAIDGKDYDARLCKSIIIYEGNLEFINAIASEIRSNPAASESAPAN
jgi:ParB/RepB/Spo0J family partition protein